MKLRVAASMAALTLSCLACATQGRGDTLVVAGQRVESPSRFVVAGEEIFAPLLPGLKHLGARADLTPDAIRITTSSRREILISRSRPEATLDGMLRPLPAVPRRSGRELALPARAVGSLLGCAVRWEEGSRTLFLHPWVRTFSLETLADRYRLTVGSEGPITYRSAKMEEPPRLVVDLLNADLADIPGDLRLEESYIRAARIRQNALAPAPEGDVVRVVIDLEEWRPYRIRASEDRCQLQVEFPLPTTRELPVDGPRVILSGIGFQRLSPRLAAVKLSVFGKPVCSSGVTEEPPSVWVEVANADNRIEERSLEVSDRIVSGVSVAPVAENPAAQRVTIALREAVPHSVISESGEVRVLLGRTEMSELCFVIDAGHGGHDPGAIGRSGLQEKEVNLDIALRVRRELEATGARVILTRTDDRPVIPWRASNQREHRRELLARCALANNAGADLFLSIHCNARESNPAAIRGTETYYRKRDSIPFAEVVQEEMVRAVGLPDGGVLYHPRPIIVLYQTNMPAVLVEVGYLSHPADERELATSELRERAAQGMVNGIKRYVEEGGLLSGSVGREVGEREGLPPAVPTPTPAGR